MIAQRRRWSAENSVSMTNVCLAGLLTGNEWGGWVAVHPALDKLPGSPRLQAEQAVYRRYGRIMPFLMTSTVASGIAASSVRDGASLEGQLARAAVGCYTAMLAITLIGNIPLNTELVALPDEPASHARLAELRDQWDRLHTARNLLNLAGFGLTVAGALTARSR
jgi:hypothetical protein